MSGLKSLQDWLATATQPSLDAPWPGEMDVAKWLWQKATPQFWREEYPDTVDYSDYVAFPRVAGMTGKSYTTTLPVDPDAPWKSPGWTMGPGGRFDVRIERDIAFGYRLWRAMMTPLETSRALIDKGAARLDPLQALSNDLPQLFEWAGGDDRLAKELPEMTLRRYIKRARKLEKVRGTPAMLEDIDKILGIQSQMEWDDTPGFLKLTIYGKPTKLVKLFFRRHLPPHLGVKLTAIESHIAYTGWAMTSKASYIQGTPPEESKTFLTSKEKITTLTI